MLLRFDMTGVSFAELQLKLEHMPVKVIKDWAELVSKYSDLEDISTGFSCAHREVVHV